MAMTRSIASKLLLAVVLAGMSLSAQSAMIRVSQESAAGAGDFDANVLGFVGSFSTALSISSFYQYNTPDGASYNGDLNGGPAPLSSVSQGFFVDASDGLHYVVVHDNPNDGSGGSAIMTTLLAGGAGGSVAFTVRDDPGDLYSTTNTGGGDRVFSTRQSWVPCCTDGFAIGDLGADFLLLAAFDTSPTGIKSWQATGAASSIALALNPLRRVRFDLAPVPLPAAAWLFVSALGLFGFIGKRRAAA